MSGPNKKQTSKGKAKESVGDKERLPDAKKSGKSGEPEGQQDVGNGVLLPSSQEGSVPTENLTPMPPFIRRPSPTLPASYYAFYSCEGHCHDLFDKFLSKHENISLRAKHAATLFLMSAAHLAKTLKLDVHRTAIWLSITWEGYQFAVKEENRSYTHLDRYFEEFLIRHCVDSSPLGCEVFSEVESRVFQKFLCRFTSLLPLLQIYLFKMTGSEPSMPRNRYLGCDPSSSEIDLANEVMEEASTIEHNLTMHYGLKDDKRADDYFKCSGDYFQKN